MQRILRTAVTAAATAALSVGSLFLATGSGASAHEAAEQPAPQAVSQAAGESTAQLANDAATYQVNEETVRRQSDFGGGTIYYPDEPGSYSAVAISPGYTAGQSSMSWYGDALAEQGIIAFTIDTRTRLDQPGSRGDQLLAALDYLVEESGVSDLVDPERLGVMGHSMGGGGTLEASVDRPELRAAVALTPWNLSKRWGDVETPTLIIGAERDSIASVNTHSIPFYNSLPDSLEKVYLELNGASHFAPNRQNSTIETYTVAWLKLFLDGDDSYEAELCPGPSTGLAISDYRSSCPFS